VNCVCPPRGASAARRSRSRPSSSRRTPARSPSSPDLSPIAEAPRKRTRPRRARRARPGAATRKRDEPTGQHAHASKSYAVAGRRTSRRSLVAESVQCAGDRPHARHAQKTAQGRPRRLICPGATGRVLRDREGANAGALNGWPFEPADLPHHPRGELAEHRRGRVPLVRLPANRPRGAVQEYRHRTDQEASAESTCAGRHRRQTRRLRPLQRLPPLGDALRRVQRTRG
jgi:hypothetical protein